MNTNEYSSGLRVSGAARAAALLACVLLAGCASVQSAQDKVGGWIEGLGDETPEPSPPPAKATAKKAAKKPAVSSAPAASAPELNPESVANETPVEAVPDASSDSSDPGVEPQAPEGSIFDPY
jgi:hypothetical protein